MIRVLRRLFYCLRIENQLLPANTKLVDSEVVEFSNRVRIPVRDSRNRIPKVKKVYEEWRSLFKLKYRQTLNEYNKRDNFKQKNIRNCLMWCMQNSRCNEADEK